MTTLAGRTIAALRSEHDGLAALVPTLSPDQLTGPSGAAEWTVADVLSHLGSGAEINLAAFRAARGEAEPPGPDFNQGVWDRWNALSPEDQVANWRESDAKLVAAFEALNSGDLAPGGTASGDVCFGVIDRDGALRLELTTAARYFGRYGLCVTRPDGRRRCGTFPVFRAGGGTWGGLSRRAARTTANPNT